MLGEILILNQSERIHSVFISIRLLGHTITHPPVVKEFAIYSQLQILYPLFVMSYITAYQVSKESTVIAESRPNANLLHFHAKTAKK